MATFLLAYDAERRSHYLNLDHVVRISNPSVEDGSLKSARFYFTLPMEGVESARFTFEQADFDRLVKGIENAGPSEKGPAS